MEISNKQLFNILNESFDDEALQEFLFMNYEPVHANLAAGQSKKQRIMALISHCKQHLKVNELLNHLKEERPTQYRKHFGASNPGPVSETGSTNSSELKKTIESFLIENRMEKALKTMEKHFEQQSDDHLRNQVQNLMGKLNANESGFHQGIVNYDNYQTEMNRIRSAIAALKDKL